MRDMVFVSHANPEDNEFALWLSLRLAAEGYPVWCDLTQLLGGEVFWSDIESAIRERTVKFLYVLTRASNEKPGSRNELALAVATERKEGLKDFVIPLWLDDLAPEDFNAEIFRRNAIGFQDGWAGGLGQLLEKFEKDGVSKKAEFGAAAVTAWWRDHTGASAGLRPEPELLYSNWYPLAPATLFFHELSREGLGPLAITEKLPYPAVQQEQYLVSFAPAADFDGRLGTGISITTSLTRRLNDASAPTEARLWNSYRDERRVLTNLLRQVWERLLANRTLPTQAFANGALAFFFAKGMLADDRAWYTGYDGKRSWRNVIGYKTLKGRNGDTSLRYWHFSLEARATSSPVIGYTMRSHVLFSDDGVNIWESKERLHKARRSQCKDWWNDKWRDLIAASVGFLAEGTDVVKLPVGAETYIELSVQPLTLSSPISFDETSLEAPIVDEYDEEDDVSSSEHDEVQGGEAGESESLATHVAVSPDT